ncbi:hypothetical protein Pst134EB_001679 [Puccinia striiformis f. sp. tritici]|nr:hypothetical protein Pst134EB_001679 [Puccinia striiformis f. sp. tritici]
MTVDQIPSRPPALIHSFNFDCPIIQQIQLTTVSKVLNKSTLILTSSRPSCRLTQIFQALLKPASRKIACFSPCTSLRYWPLAWHLLHHPNEQSSPLARGHPG